MNPIVKILGGLVKPVAEIFSKREDRKKAVATIRAQTDAAKTDGDIQVKLSKSQWEIIGKKAEDGTWKDEYITLIVTSPLLIIILGSLQTAFTGDRELLDAAGICFIELKKAGVEMGDLMFYTVLAAIGIKAFK